MPIYVAYYALIIRATPGLGTKKHGLGFSLYFTKADTFSSSSSCEESFIKWLRKLIILDFITECNVQEGIE